MSNNFGVVWQFYLSEIEEEKIHETKKKIEKKITYLLCLGRQCHENTAEKMLINLTTISSIEMCPFTK